MASRSDLKLWEIYPNLWKTETKFTSWLRGNLRKACWNRHLVKLEFIKHNRIRIQNPVEKNRARFPEVWGGVCALTGQECLLKDLEIDHKIEAGSLRSVADLQNFVEGLVLITEDDLQFVSKDAHRSKSMAYKQGITFEEAHAERKAIALCKTNSDVQWLKDHGVEPEKSKPKRRVQIVTQLLKEQNE